MSIIRAIRNQLGLSVTPSNNFTWDASADNGTVRVYRGNAGTPIQDILTVSSNNVITAGTGAVLAPSGPAFSANNSSTQAVSNSTLTKVSLQTENFDTANAFDNVTNYRFQPLVAGYYQINGALSYTATTVSAAVASLGKNLSIFASTNLIGVVPNSGILQVSEIVFLNGSTDFVELFGQINATSGNTFGTGCRLSGFLARGV